ncbi:HetP family heterocyst commitment protein [Lyngbya sp. PCC 8106]|nr:HetP family heterocyst commitment protein [Lyngbya sp. PCC 8106]
MKNEFNQVIEAILAGKYSWACVLILQICRL